MVIDSSNSDKVNSFGSAKHSQRERTAFMEKEEETLGEGIKS